MQPADLGDPGRQRLQAQSLHPEQLPRDRTNVFLVSRVDLVSPLPRLLIEIFPSGERVSRQKVILNEREGPFHARPTVLALPIALRQELKTETLGKHRQLSTGTISPPAPRSTTTCVLSIMIRAVVPPK